MINFFRSAFVAGYDGKGWTPIHIGMKKVIATVLILNIEPKSHSSVFETLYFLTTSNDNLMIK